MSRTSAITTAFRQRANAVSGVEFKDADPGDATPAPVDELPEPSWKKADIVDYLVRNEVIENPEDVKGLTKDQLLENFFDDEG